MSPPFTENKRTTQQMYIKSTIPIQAKVPECNAYEALWNRHEQAGCPDDLIIHIEGASEKKTTYQEFRTRVVLAATALDKPLSGNGEMVAIISQSSSDCAALVHSLLLLATPFVMFDPCWTPLKFENALKLTKPTRMFVQDQLVPTFVPMAADNIAMESIYVLGQKTEGFRTFEEMVEDARSQAMAPVSPRPASKDTLAYLMFSSGTTGPPKAIMISHGNIVANINKGRIRSYFASDNTGSTLAQRNKTPVYLVKASMAFLSGLGSCCFYPFIAPATYVIITDPSLEATLEAIARYQITVVRFRPAFIRELVNYSRLKETDLSSIRIVLTSGSYFPPDLLAKMAIAMPHKFYISQIYGTTESFGITVLPTQPIISGETNFHMLESVGTLFPGVEARILRDDESEADVNEPGELYVRSERVALGYWDNEEATRETFVDGWVRTGDIVRVDDNGRFFIVGRTKDTFKTPAGRQISPFPIEDVLLTEPQGLVADALVAGVAPHLGSKDEKGKVPRAWIVLSDEGKKVGADVVIKELEVWYQKKLSEDKWLHGGIEIVDEIPKSASGKPLRTVLQKNYEERVCGNGNA